MSAWGLGNSPWRVWIINEAHAMTARAVQAWLTLLDRLPPYRLIVFTTTKTSRSLFGEFSAPFRGRVTPLRLTKIGLADAGAKLVKKIAKAEGLDGRPLAQYRRLMAECNNSIREALQRVEAGEMSQPVEHSPAIKKMMAGAKKAQRRARATRSKAAAS